MMCKLFKIAVMANNFKTIAVYYIRQASIYTIKKVWFDEEKEINLNKAKFYKM